MWNYRVVKFKDDNSYNLCEVFYNKNNEICGMSEPFISVHIDEGVDEIKETLKQMLKDIESPIVDEPNIYASWDIASDEAFIGFEKNL